MNISQIKNPAELLEIKDGDSPYLFNEIISQDGFSKKRLAKRKLKLLKTIDPVVRKILKPGEQVFYITDGIRSSTFEQFFIGWVVYYYNYMAFVFTSDRIILIHLKKINRRGTFIGEVNYTDLQKIKTSFSGSITLKFKNKKSLIFSRVPKLDRKYVKEFLSNTLVEQQTIVDKQGKSLVNLCPQCFTKVDGHPERCLNCLQEFKSSKKAGILSFIMPGLGDIYLGSKGLGILELIGMVYVWLIFIAAAVEEQEAGGDVLAVSIVFLIILGIFHFLDAMKSLYLGKKGIYPKTKIEYPN